MFPVPEWALSMWSPYLAKHSGEDRQGIYIVLRLLAGAASKSVLPQRPLRKG
jgi:hypothetical protein